MKKDRLTDRIRRAYEMEEVMAGKLLDICRKESLIDKLPHAVQEKFRRAFAQVREDTERHRKTMEGLLH
ncbi:MAG: hypothetical protein RDV41_03295 [Planctomycetota bacterium]|nr:hypothetical protein [Planctomycetota bacterium]